MTDAELQEKLETGGTCSIHYLLKISGGGLDPIYLVDNNEDITYNSQTYTASAFDYTPPSSITSGASLSISSLPDDNAIFETVETASYNAKIKLDVIEVLVDGSDVTLLNNYATARGSFSMGYDGAITFNAEADDRQSMTFPPYTFDTDNNKGNA